MATAADLYWAAGFLEGEGCFQGAGRGQLSIEAAQVQKEPLLRLLRLFGGTIGTYRRKLPWRTINKWKVHGTRAAGIMLTLFSLMSPWRKRQIKVALGKWYRKPVSNMLKTACNKGHPFTKKNTRRQIGAHGPQRVCRTCQLLAVKRYQHRKAA